MKVTQEKLPATSQISLEIEIPPEMSVKAYDKVIQQFSRSASIPGFRKGKVPRHILLQRLGAGRIKAAAVEELIQNSIQQAVKQEDIDALGNFQLISSFEELVSQFEPGQPLTFSASVDVPPEVKLKEYRGLAVKANEVKYESSDLDKFLEERRSEQATLIPVDGRPAQMGDVAVVDYSGQLVASFEGEPVEEIPGGKAENFQVELLEGRFVPGFCEGMVGMNPGDTKEVPVQFPENYPNLELAGKYAVFTITVKDLKEKELPELDDDFAQAVSEFQTLAELRESVEARLKAKALRETKANVQSALREELVNLVEFELPETMIGREIDNMLQQAAIQVGLDVRKLYSHESLPELQAELRPQAIKKLKQSMGLKELAVRESIQVEPAEINARLEELRPQLSEDTDPERLRQVVASEMLKEKALDWLEEHANIEWVDTESQATAGETTQEEDSQATGSSNPGEPTVPQATEASVVPQPPESQPTE